MRILYTAFFTTLPEFLFPSWEDLSLSQFKLDNVKHIPILSLVTFGNVLKSGGQNLNKSDIKIVNYKDTPNCWPLPLMRLAIL